MWIEMADKDEYYLDGATEYIHSQSCHLPEETCLHCDMNDVCQWNKDYQSILSE